MFYVTRDNNGVEEFCLKSFMMTTYMEDYILEENEKLKKVFRDTV